MKTVSTVQENAEDIYADAKSINEERAPAAGTGICSRCTGSI